MTALSDLQGSVDAAQTKLQTLQQEVADFVNQNSGGATDEQLVQLKGQVDGLNQQIDQISATVAPAQPAS